MVDLLIAARLAAGLTQHALSERLGRPQSFVAKIETRQRRLDVLELFDVLAALGVDPMSFAKKAAAATRR